MFVFVYVMFLAGFVTSVGALISQSWKKELSPIVFPITDMVSDFILEPNGVPDLHLRNQEQNSWSIAKYPVFPLYFA